MDGKMFRQKIVYSFLALYILYGIFGIGMTGLLFSFAIGLIITSFNQPLELIVAGTILSGLMFKIITDIRRKEGFEGRPIKGAKENVPLGSGEDPSFITKRIEEITQKNVFQPSGVLSSSYAECFADMNSSEQPSNAGSATAKPAGEKTPAPSSSTPAATNAPTVSGQLASGLPAPEVTSSLPDPKNNEKPVSTETPQQTASSIAGFSDKTTDGMFKLGSIPADAVGGAHIDIGTTLMNALNSLKPDQVKAMTDDTRKLMETQKSLMGMLTTMKPLITDGKQMMETFTQMFGKQ
jgi:hypothetical protein